MNSIISLGSDVESKTSVLFQDALRSSHMHVLGATGTGKSRFLLSLIQQDISEKNGICLIDPHGELYQHTLEWLSERETLLRFRKVRLIDVTSRDWCFGFNPLQASSEDQRDATVSTAVNAIAHVLGDGDIQQTPLLKETLLNVCLALSYAGLTLNEAPYLLNYQYREEREYITSFIDYEPHRIPWRRYNQFSKSDYHEYFSSSGRRFQNFISNPYVRRIFGQANNVIDFRKAMDDGEIILINLGREGGFMPPESSELIGRLIINNLMAKSFERPSREKPAPFTLYVDEAHRYLSSDIATILAETRKFGLHMVLSHQLLSQLKDAGDDVYAGVMGNARTKAVFALEDPEDAKMMAERVFVDEFDYEKAKRSLDRPVVIGHEEVELSNRSQNRSSGNTKGESSSTTDTSTAGSSVSQGQGYAESEAWSTSSGEGSAEVFSESASFIEIPTNPFGLDGDIKFEEALRVSQSASIAESNFSGSGHSEGVAGSYSSSNTESEAFSRGETFGVNSSTSIGYSSTVGVAATLKPIIQWMTGGVYSLEEQRHLFMRHIMRLPQQHVLVAFPGQKSILVKAHDVPDLISSKIRKKRIAGELAEKNPYLSESSKVEEEIEERIKFAFSKKNKDETGWSE